ncbi:Quinone oxidoreductase [Chionoecetes opilio]|uniref:Quinone oxidoreductase n=1 Tax=Chionoecetes opilio TaxID=41210 RepID=A0A8J5D0D8_CHIOP|nr:Quinone oxidoreductase [Chionoecetes opilio]
MSGCQQVLIKMHASGVNPVDTYIREGMYAVLPELPYVPGKDGAGVVEALGTKVTKFKLEDRVFCSSTSRHGTLGRLATFPEAAVFPLGGNLSFEEGACLGIPYFTAYRALVQKASAKKGERLLVHGASGGVGLAAVQLGRELGLQVVGTAGTDEGISLVKETGAHDVFNHRDPKYLKKLGAEKFDIIIEMLANVNLGNDLTLMNPRGRTIVVGSRGATEINPRNLMQCESAVMGVALGTATAEEVAEVSAAVCGWHQGGWVKPKVHKVYSHDEAAQAHHDIIHNKGAQGNLVAATSPPPRQPPVFHPGSHQPSTTAATSLPPRQPPTLHPGSHQPSTTAATKPPPRQPPALHSLALLYGDDA